MSIEELEHIIEAILFANGDVISIKSIANATENDEKTIKTVINNLSDKDQQKFVKNILDDISLELLNDVFWLYIMINATERINNEFFKTIIMSFNIFFSTIFVEETIDYGFGEINNNSSITKSQIKKARNYFLKDLPTFESKKNRKIINDMENRFHQAINDDLNMPLAMSVVWEAVKYQDKSPKIAKLLEKFDTVLGLKITEKREEEIPQEILELVEQRKVARNEKNWTESDRLRDLIAQKGYSVKDTKDGAEVSKI